MNLEQQRQIHFECDSLIQQATSLLLQTTKQNQLYTESLVKEILLLHQYKSKQLLSLYQQSDKDSIGSVDAFYALLKDHTIQPSFSLPEPMTLSFELDSIFSGEESLGKFLDLVLHYNRFLNLKDVKKISYLAYVQVFSDASRIPIETRKTTEYKAYIHDLRSYLESFIVRSKPLFNIEEALHKIQNQFEKKWQRKQFPDWFLKNTGPLFCEACQKEFKNEAVFEAHKTGKKHLKAVENMNQQNNPIEKFKDIVLVEFSIHEFKKILNVIVDDTLAHIERKQTLTDRERVFLFLNF